MTRDTLGGLAVGPQEEMLHGLQTSGTGGEDWKVLVVDDVTVKVFSSACKLSDVTEENVSRACLAPVPRGEGSRSCGFGAAPSPRPAVCRSASLTGRIASRVPCPSGGGPVQAA